MNYELEEWVEVVCGRRTQPSDSYIVKCFPTDSLREEYLSVAYMRAEGKCGLFSAVFGAFAIASVAGSESF